MGDLAHLRGAPRFTECWTGQAWSSLVKQTFCDKTANGRVWVQTCDRRAVRWRSRGFDATHRLQRNRRTARTAGKSTQTSVQQGGGRRWARSPILLEGTVEKKMGDLAHL